MATEENPFRFEYMLLSRLQSDCEYYLKGGIGGENARHDKHLWAGNVTDQIAKMRELYAVFPEDAKPEWLTLEEIAEFEKEMQKTA